MWLLEALGTIRRKHRAALVHAFKHIIFFIIIPMFVGSGKKKVHPSSQVTCNDNNNGNRNNSWLFLGFICGFQEARQLLCAFQKERGDSSFQCTLQTILPGWAWSRPPVHGLRGADWVPSPSWGSFTLPKMPPSIHSQSES
jgi:hypothetical protein